MRWPTHNSRRRKCETKLKFRRLKTLLPFKWKKFCLLLLAMLSDWHLRYNLLFCIRFALSHSRLPFQEIYEKDKIALKSEEELDSSDKKRLRRRRKHHHKVREETKENEIKRKEKLSGTAKTQTSMKDTMKTIKEGKVRSFILNRKDWLGPILGTFFGCDKCSLTKLFSFRTLSPLHKLIAQTTHNQHKCFQSYKKKLVRTCKP